MQGYVLNEQTFPSGTVTSDVTQPTKAHRALK